MNNSPCSLHFVQKLVHLLLILLCWINTNHPDILRHDQVEYGMKHTTLKAKNDLKEHSKLFQHCYQLYTITNEVKEQVMYGNQFLDKEISFLKEQAESLGKSWLFFVSGVKNVMDRPTSVYWKFVTENVDAMRVMSSMYKPQILEMATKVTNWNILNVKKSNQFVTVFQNCTEKLARSFVGNGNAAAYFLFKGDKDDAEPFNPKVFEQLRTLFLELASLGSRLGNFTIPDEKSFIQFIILKEDYTRLEEEILTRTKMHEKNLNLVPWSHKSHTALSMYASKMLSDITNIHRAFQKVSTDLKKLFVLDDFEEYGTNWLGNRDCNLMSESEDDDEKYLKTLVSSLDVLEEKVVISTI